MGSLALNPDRSDEVKSFPRPGRDGQGTITPPARCDLVMNSQSEGGRVSAQRPRRMEQFRERK